MKSILSSRSSQPIFGIAIMSVALLFLFMPAFLSASPLPGADGNETTAGIKTFWSLTKLGGGISAAIVFVFGLGIFLIVMQLYQLTQDKARGRALLSTNYRQMSVGEVGKMVKQHPNSYVGRLYSILLSIFHATGDTRDFHDEIANYIELQQDRFGTFRGRLAFLSDTAGALGLLGTVWGMFATFFGGNLDSQRILNGMGLALVTTLIGLVASIILNFFATEVFSVFNKRMNQLSSKADEFRLWLMAILHQRNKKNGGSGPANGASSRGDKEAAGTPNASTKTMSSLALKPVSHICQDGFIGQKLADRIDVFVETGQGQRIAGVPVCFEVLDGGGSLANHKGVAVVKTDGQGIAGLKWTLGTTVGPQRVRVSIPEEETDSLEFTAMAKPMIPDLQLDKEVSGSANASNKGVA